MEKAWALLGYNVSCDLALIVLRNDALEKMAAGLLVEALCRDLGPYLIVRVKGLISGLECASSTRLRRKADSFSQ